MIPIIELLIPYCNYFINHWRRHIESFHIHRKKSTQLTENNHIYLEAASHLIPKTKCKFFLRIGGHYSGNTKQTKKSCLENNGN